jgi:hypothetical protein
MENTTIDAETITALCKLTRIFDSYSALRTPDPTDLGNAMAIMQTLKKFFADNNIDYHTR